MSTRRIARAARDTLRIVRRYLSDGRFRAGVRRELARTENAAPAASIGRATPYAGLTSSSTALAGITVADGEPRLNVVVGGVGEGRTFAGVDTALRAAVKLAGLLDLGVRVVALEEAVGEPEDAERALRERYSCPELVLAPPSRLDASAFTPHDVWVATHFLTAHAVQVAASLHLVDPARVVYLIQDYEPGFVAWSTDYSVAQSTYHAGFLPLVNSRPVANHLLREEGLEVPTDQIFAPALDLDRLARVAERRASTPGIRIGFYGRPSKQRNLFRLGVASLRLAAATLGERPDVSFVSVGEGHKPIRLGAGYTMRSLGKLDWEEYYAFLAGVDVFLSLQLSPHPSHPPLEAAISGAWAVTNEVRADRAALHPRLLAVPAHVESLAAAIVSAAERPSGAYLAPDSAALGGDFESAIATVARKLPPRS
jgi:hypothetical protein